MFSRRYTDKISRFARNDKFRRLFTNASIIKLDKLVKSRKIPFSVIPAKAGIQ